MKNFEKRRTAPQQYWVYLDPMYAYYFLGLLQTKDHGQCSLAEALLMHETIDIRYLNHCLHSRTERSVTG